MSQDSSGPIALRLHTHESLTSEAGPGVSRRLRVEHTRAEIDALVYELCGLSDEEIAVVGGKDGPRHPRIFVGQGLRYRRPVCSPEGGSEMRLVRLEIRNYRSVKELVDDKAIVSEGLDCLVGGNNAGKSNILKAISFLLSGERPSEDLHYGRDTSLVMDVRGYFAVAESDFDLLKIENKREAVRLLVLRDGTIGICRRSDRDDLQVIGYYPREERLRKDRLEGFRDEVWEEKASKDDFGVRMQSEYPELVPFLANGKECNKGEWLEAYQRMVDERPEGLEFVEIPASPPTGISADLSNMLPRVVFVPAVKELSDATRATRTAELGGLLTELSLEVHEELDGLINEALRDVSKHLNVVRDEATGVILSDERHPGVTAIEGQITDYMQEAFQDVSVSLEFPNPESKVMFESVRVWVDEEGFGRVRVDYAGEGVKRVLVSSLIRTLADLRQGRLRVSAAEDREGEPDRGRRSLLILYEEAELFLHPGLQRILLTAFERLRDSGDQVIYSTHSPFMLPTPLTSTINLVRKDPQEGTGVIEAHRLLSNVEGRQRNRLLQIQNVSSYVFADRVLLVEGVSDNILLRKLAPALDPSWDFDQQNIPILPVIGKGDLPLFRHFLSSLGVRTFVLMDVDCIDDIVTTLCDDQAVRQVRDELLRKCQELVDAGEFESDITRRHVNTLVESYEWKDVFERLKCLCEALGARAAPTEEQIGCLERLLAKGELRARRRALTSDHPDVVRLRLQLVDALLPKDVLCLSGTIEDYYPSQGHGVEAALAFDPTGMSRADLGSHFTPLSDGHTTDVEAFLGRLFGAAAA